MGKFIKGMAAGVVIGAAVDMIFIMPYCCNSRTKRMIRRRGKRMIDMMEDAYDNIHGMVK